MKKSEDTNINIKIAPKFVDTALTNIADEPTRQMGSTLGDIWFLVFGGIGHLAEKKKMRYAFALEKYKEELHDKIADIPIENRIEADIQIIAPALEASKYCIEKEELRRMFVELIASTVDREKEAIVHPIFIDIIKRLSHIDAQLLRSLSLDDFSNDSIFDEQHIFFRATIEELAFSASVLRNLGLIDYKDTDSMVSEDSLKDSVINLNYNHNRVFSNDLIGTSFDIIFKTLNKYVNEQKFSGDKFPSHKLVVKFFKTTIQLTHLGQRFKTICLV